jgi:hypothetical protein
MRISYVRLDQREEDVAEQFQRSVGTGLIGVQVIGTNGETIKMFVIPRHGIT